MEHTNGLAFKERYLQVYETDDVVDNFHLNPLLGQAEYIYEYFKNLTKNRLHKNSEENGKSLHLLDVGCGNGRQTKLFANYFDKVTAIDISKAQIAKAKESFPAKNVTYMVGTSSVLPVDDESVDVISCLFTAHYFPDMNKFVSECKRALKPRGFVAIWGDNLENVTLDPPLSGSTEDTRKLCAELLAECKKHASSVGDCEWHMFDSYQTLYQNITGIKKFRPQERKFDVNMTLDGLLSFYMSMQVFRNVEWAWNRFAEKLKQLWGLESVRNEDIKLKITRSPFVIILTKNDDY